MDLLILALYALANNSPHESIRRSAHGAIWVIKRTPERPTMEQGSYLLNTLAKFHFRYTKITISV